MSDLEITRKVIREEIGESDKRLTASIEMQGETFAAALSAQSEALKVHSEYVQSEFEKFSVFMDGGPAGVPPGVKTQLALGDQRMTEIEGRIDNHEKIHNLWRARKWKVVIAIILSVVGSAIAMPFYLMRVPIGDWIASFL